VHFAVKAFGTVAYLKYDKLCPVSAHAGKYILQDYALCSHLIVFMLFSCKQLVFVSKYKCS